jgi:TctA family transporter
MVLAMILGPAAEISFRQSLMRSGGSFTIFAYSPIAMTLIAASGALLVWNLYRSLRKAPAGA